MAKKPHAGISEQWKASLHRLEDARALLLAERWRGAMYMAGYAVECRLKYKLMERWRCRTLNDLEQRLNDQGVDARVFTHSLEALVGLMPREQARWQADLPSWALFAKTNQWVPAWRYSPHPADQGSAEGFIHAVERVLSWMDHNM